MSETPNALILPKKSIKDNLVEITKQEPVKKRKIKLKYSIITQ